MNETPCENVISLSFNQSAALTHLLDIRLEVSQRSGDQALLVVVHSANRQNSLNTRGLKVKSVLPA